MSRRHYSTRSYEVSLPGGLLSAHVEVSGRWVAGSLEYGPPEEPDTTITQAWRVGGRCADEREVDPSTLSLAEVGAITLAALTRDEHADDCGEDASYRPQGARR